MATPALGTYEYSQYLLDQAKSLGITGSGVTALQNSTTGNTGTISYTGTPTTSTAPLGSTQRTNDLLREASAITGIQAPTFTQETLVPSTTTINSQTLAPTTTTPLVAPNPSYTYPVASLDATAPAELTATPAEQEQSGMIDKLKDLYSSYTGQTAYRAEQEKLLGIPELTKTQNDLVSQLTAIKNEAAAIPLQLQQGAAERGVTTPLLGAQQNSRLRTNAIAALGVSTLLEASRGNLSMAQSLVDKAVEQKYGPILEQINALRANLELIREDPETTLQDRNRAIAQDYAQQQIQMSLQEKMQNEKEIWNIATTAASNGQNFKPSGQYTSLALTLQAIQNAPTKEQALYIASMTGLISAPAGSTSGTQKILGNSTSGYYTYDPVTGQTTPISNPNPSSGGTTTSGGTISSIPSSEVTALKNALNASKYSGPEADGKYADPNLYLQNYTSFIEAGGSAEVFFRYFPPSTYINPANTWLPDDIMRFVKSPSSTTSSSPSSGIVNPFL